MRVAGERLHPAIRAGLLHPAHPTGHLGTGRGRTCFGVFHEAVGTKWHRCAVRPDRDLVNGSAGRTPGKGRQEPLPIHGWERTGNAHAEFRMGWAFPTTFLTVMRHIAPYDLHSTLTIIRIMRASTSTPPGRAGHTIWSPLP